MTAERIVIEFDTQNAAFEDSPIGEIARILRSLADCFEIEGGPFPDDSLALRDLNGKLVGFCRVHPDGSYR